MAPRSIRAAVRKTDCIYIPPPNEPAKREWVAFCDNGSLALDFAVYHHVDQIVLAASFTSLREEAVRIVGNPLAHLLTENYDNRENLREIFKRDPHVRVDIYHGTNDEDIPVQMSRVLAKEFPAIHYHEIPGADHGDVIENAQEQVIAGTSR